MHNFRQVSIFVELSENMIGLPQKDHLDLDRAGTTILKQKQLRKVFVADMLRYSYHAFLFMNSTHICMLCI